MRIGPIDVVGDEILPDAGGELWICVESGRPGRFVRASELKKNAKIFAPTDWPADPAPVVPNSDDQSRPVPVVDLNPKRLISFEEA